MSAGLSSTTQRKAGPSRPPRVPRGSAGPDNLIRAKAPLRISFAGGGTDVPPFPEREGGLVLNATINRYAYGTLRPRADGQVCIESLDFGMSATYDTDQGLPFDGKLDLAKAAIQKVGASDGRGLELFLHSNAPPGSGLGSSSTMMVALIGLLKDFRNLPLTDYEIAELAYVIEREDLGLKGGVQDQYAATFGGFNFLELWGDRVVVNPLRISDDAMLELEHNLLLCYTGQTRRSDRIIDDQTTRFEKSEEDALEGLRLQKELAVEMKNALLQRQLSAFGDLLDHAWEAKKRMSPRITNSVIDEMYATARAHGALGGKVTGAGGGGYMLLYCDYRTKHKVADALIELGASVEEIAFESRGLRTWRTGAARR
jgi:D-glycero-alpha-D-manno-heptose-7-phosphate kinase